MGAAARGTRPPVPGTEDPRALGKGRPLQTLRLLSARGQQPQPRPPWTASGPFGVRTEGSSWVSGREGNKLEIRPQNCLWAPNCRASSPWIPTLPAREEVGGRTAQKAPETPWGRGGKQLGQRETPGEAQPSTQDPVEGLQEDQARGPPSPPSHKRQRGSRQRRAGLPAPPLVQPGLGLGRLRRGPVGRCSLGGTPARPPKDRGVPAGCGRCVLAAASEVSPRASGGAFSVRRTTFMTWLQAEAGVSTHGGEGGGRRP